MIQLGHDRQEAHEGHLKSSDLNPYRFSNRNRTIKKPQLLELWASIIIDPTVGRGQEQKLFHVGTPHCEVALYDIHTRRPLRVPSGIQSQFSIQSEFRKLKNLILGKTTKDFVVFY